jgi:hypothetical protein
MDATDSISIVSSLSSNSSKSSKSTKKPTNPIIKKVIQSKSKPKETKTSKPSTSPISSSPPSSPSGIYDDENPPHLDDKNYINGVLARHKPQTGKFIVLDGTHFRTSKALKEPQRTIIPQFNPQHYEQMRQDGEFGSCVIPTDLRSYLRTCKEPIGILYADICGSIKEMMPILEELNHLTFTSKAVIACTICARDAEKKGDNGLDYVTDLMDEMYNRFDNWKRIGDKTKIKYGNMCTIIIQKRE